VDAVLLSSPSSPYARKIRVALHELGAAQAVCVRDVDTRDPHSGLREVNAAGRLPTLVVDGRMIHDSPVILEWVDATFGPRLLPPVGDARWDALVRQATGDGLTDTLVPWRMEQMRPESERSSAFQAGCRARADRILDALEQDAARGGLDGAGGAFDVGAIGIACALGYLDFRFGDVGWRATRPALKRWYEAGSARPSMRATRPHNLGEPPPA
jgi:glutathione S-transferase